MLLYRKFGDAFKKTKTKIILAVLFLVVDDLSYLPIVNITGKLIDYLKTDNTDLNIVLIYIMIIITATILSYISYVIYGYLTGKAATNLKIYFKEKIFGKILKKSPDFFEKTTSGDVLGLANNDTDFIYEHFTFGILQLVDSTIIPIVYITYLATFLSFKLTLISIIPFPLIMIIDYFISKRIHSLHLEINDKFGKSNQEILEIVEGIKLVRSYVNENVRLNKFSKIIKVYYDLVYLQSKIFMFMWSFNSLISGISISVCFIYGMYLVKVGEITHGALVQFFYVLNFLSWSFNAAGMYVNSYRQCEASIDRLNKFFEDKTEVIHGDIKCGSIESIEFKDFDFKYPSGNANTLKKISFTLNKGETLGIVGKSGSGKSTIINQFLRIYNFEKNKIFINGIAYENYDLDSVRKKFGYVSQENILLSKTVRENILFGSKSENDDKIIEVMEKADFYKDIKNLKDGLDTVVGERGLGLSGGQKQRISLARALYRDPEILILDDSFSAVDANTEFKIVKSLKEYRNEKTNIIVSHRISAIEHADKIIVLDNGEITEFGNHKELIERGGWYKEQFEYQSLEKEKENEE